MLRSHKSEDWLDEGSKWKERVERKRQYEEARSRTPDVPPPPNAEANHYGAQPLPINFGMLMRHVDEHLRQVDDHLHGLQRQPVPLHAIEILSSDDEDYSPTEDEYE